MDILQLPFDFRVDIDFGRANHNAPNKPPIDNPGTPKGEPTLLPEKIGSRRPIASFRKGKMTLAQLEPMPKHSFEPARKKQSVLSTRLREEVWKEAYYQFTS